MKRIARTGLMLMAIVALSATPSAWAACNLDTQLVGHIIGGWVTDCPDSRPVEGYIWLLSSPTTVHSNGTSMVCRHEGEVTDTLVDCTFSPGSGIDGDGLVTVYYEYGVQSTGISIGCPNPAQAGNGTTPLGVQLICNDGSGILFQIGFSEDFQSFPLEFAGPADFSPVAASAANTPTLTSFSAGPTPEASSVCINVPAPAVVSDCNPGSLSAENGGLSCPDPGVRPAAARGELRFATGPCDADPDLRLANWQPTAVQPDVDGNACNVVSAPDGQCVYFGMVNTYAGVAASGVGQWIRVAGPAAAGDKVKIDDASTAQGKVRVAFSTENETSIVGFNVYGGSAKLNGNLIAAKGVGSNAYTFEIGRGALKGGKTVVVEAVKADGTVVKTAPVALK